MINFHIIGDLGSGGCQAILFNIVSKTPAYKHHIISFKHDGIYYEKFLSIGVQVHIFPVNNLENIFKSFFKIINLFKFHNPDGVNYWMYHSILLSIFLKFGYKTKIIWHIHNTKLYFSKSKFTTILIARLISLFSYFIPDNIIYCAEAARNYHEKIYYCKRKSKNIFNGVNINLFLPHYEYKKSKFTIGMIARYDPIKGHILLLESLSKLPNNLNFRCLMYGDGIDLKNTKLVKLINSYHLEEKVKLCGVTNDPQVLYKNLDLLVLPSFQEAFPNVLLEAMSSGVLCISSNVGDCKLILSETGWIFEPGNRCQLTSSIIEAYLLRERSEVEWQRKINAARNRVIKKFNETKMLQNYVNLWEETF